MARRLEVFEEHWKTRAPFRISGRTFTGFDLVVCSVTDGAHTGRGEAAGVFYTVETPATMRSQIEAVAADLEAGADRDRLLELMPPGGARNALDCALWDLEAKRSGKSAWNLAGVEARPVTTLLTVGIMDTPEEMGERAAELAAVSPNLKIKLNDDRPVERIAAIRAACPDAQLMADVNGGWDLGQLLQWAPALKDLGLTHLEQPLPRGGDAQLRRDQCPLPLFADESCLHLGELDHTDGRYAGIVIKLDKTGGLTEALQLAQAAKQRGLRTMVGCMGGTSLAMAPAHALAQVCEIADIDGALFLDGDRPDGLRYEGAVVSVPANCSWGA